MSPRSAAWLGWSLFGLYVLTVAATVGLAVFGDSTGDDWLVVLSFGYAVVGLLVATREPANAIGWLLLATAVGCAVASGTYAYARDSDRPAAVAMAWTASWSWIVWTYLVTMALPLLFPTGQLLSSRWRAALGVVAAAVVLSVVGAGLADGNLDVEAPEPVPNPLGITGTPGDIVQGCAVLGGILAMTGLILGVVALVLRFRRARGRERQQIKVFVYAAVALCIAVVLFVVGGVIDTASSSQSVHAIHDLTWLPMVFLLSLGIPLAIGLAILRHQLYGIDVVINRTLVYGALTVILALSYLALVLLFERVLSPLTSDSELAVAGSTLAVAALFRPARRRIQSIVDRRFYRQRYDAARTLDAFANRLRDELDLETLTADLQQVTQDTLQPAHVSVWLRGADR